MSCFFLSGVGKPNAAVARSVGVHGEFVFAGTAETGIICSKMCLRVLNAVGCSSAFLWLSSAVVRLKQKEALVSCEKIVVVVVVFVVFVAALLSLLQLANRYGLKRVVKVLYTSITVFRHFLADLVTSL